MAFQVSHNSRTKHYFANPQIAIQENMTRSLYNLLLVLHLSLSSCSTLHTHTHTQTHKHTTVYLACACAPRHNNQQAMRYAPCSSLFAILLLQARVDKSTLVTGEECRCPGRLHCSPGRLQECLSVQQIGYHHWNSRTCLYSGHWNVHYTEPPPAYASHPKATIVTVPTAAEVRCS